MEPQELYEYPPLVICPAAWYDSKKARALGFSPDAVKYSLGYFAGILPDLPVSQRENAKNQFHTQYHKLKFSSLDAYLKAIAVDFKRVKSMAEALGTNDTSSVYLCTGCTDIQKLFFDRGICYVVQLSPQNASSSRGSDSGGPMIWMGMQDHSDGTVPAMYLDRWRIYTVPSNNATMKYSVAAPVFLENSGMHFLAVTAQHFVNLKDGDCVDNDQVPQYYSPDHCYATCMHANKSDGCSMFQDHPYAPNTPQLHPTAYCNKFDYSSSGFNKFANMAAPGQQIALSLESQSCVKRCPQKCERTIYQIHLQSSISQTSVSRAVMEVNATSPVWNMSIVYLITAHQGLIQGGILTMKQFSTITPAGFISNVGGALGLFVGATIMTLAQVIMFLIKTLIDKMKYRKLGST